MRRAFITLLLVLISVSLGCGKKGPPLAPLNMAPEAPQDVSGRRLGDTVYLQMKVPTKSAAGHGPFSVDHLEVYAVTLAPGTPAPPNRDLLKPAQIVAKIPVRPPADPDAPEPDESEKTKETRPGPGDLVTFIEKLTPAQLAPQVITPPSKPAEGSKKTPPKTEQGSAAAPATAAAAAPPEGPAVLTRTYVVRAVAKNGNVGPASPRIRMPLLTAPGRVRAGSTSWNESSVILNWEPPPSTSDEAPGVLYNVYSAPAAGSGGEGVPVTAPVPLNEKPLDAPTFTHAGAEAGKQQCFVVRAAAAVGTTIIEGDPSEPMCVTPTDTFPPAAPKGLTAVGATGAINLIWDANAEPDLAGYVVLRGEAPGDTLQPLTPQAIRETRYTDSTAKPGVPYVYAVIAIDKAGNKSNASNRVQETAR
jgi:predicted small lipoprotein YifL